MTEPPAGGRRILLWALLIGLLIGGLDGSIVNIMLPTLQSVFKTGVSQIMMLATAYLTMMAAFQLLLGRFSDLFDPVAVFLIGIIVFLSGSILCALSGSFHQILAGRAVQGLGSAMLSASFGGIILRNFSRERIGSIIGVLLSAMSVGTIIGPPLGGFFVEHLSWHWAFVINIPLCLIVIGGITVYQRGNQQQTKPSIGERLRLLDLRGALLSCLMFASLPTALGMAARGDWHSPLVWSLFGLFAVSLCLFVYFGRRAENPLIRLELFTDPRLVLIVSVKFVLYMIINGILLIFPFFLTRYAGLSASGAGVMMLTNACAMAVATPLVGRFSDRFGGSLVLLLSAAALLASAMASLAAPRISSSAGLAGILILFGIASSAVVVSSTTLLLQLAPKGQEGVFSAINTLTLPVGGAIGLSLFSLVYARGAAGLTGVAAAKGGFLFAAICLLACACLLLICAAAYSKAASAHLRLEA